MKAHSFSLHALSLIVLFCAVFDASAFYNPTVGRWASRDPIEERGGQNVYAAMRNDPIGRIDYLGLAYSLSYKTLLKKPLECGSFVWQINWLLRPKAHVNGGFGAQHMNVVIEVTDCKGVPWDKTKFASVPGLNFKTPSDDYWEAWSFRGNTDHTTTVSKLFPDDTWSLPDFGCSKGKATFRGDMNYFDGEIYPSIFKQQANHPAGLAPSAGTWQPHRQPDASISRTLTVEWDCCPDNKGKVNKATKLK